MREVPVNWHYVGTRRVHPIKESWRGVKGLLQIKRAAQRGDYGATPTGVAPSGAVSP